MILIADSGSTKTAWWLVNNGQKMAEYYTSGINPFYQSEQDITAHLKENLIQQLDVSQIKEIYFYGAGCHFPEKKNLVKSAIQSLFTLAKIEINNDLLGACRAMLQNKKGVVCILGTGSNSCFYDGTSIVENVSPLGYVLGDEGSGAVLGKLLVADVLKNQLPDNLKEKFLSQFNTSIADVLENVYKKPFPNRYLAGFSFFITENIQEKHIYHIVYKSFVDFFERNIMQYDYKHNEIHFVGSVAFYLKDVLEEVACDLDVKIADVKQSPMEGLFHYHSK